MPNYKKLSDLDRILGRLDVGDCWEWQGNCLKNGYGKSHAGSSTDGTYRTVLVHRFVYEGLTGRDLAGLQLDHLCKNRKCCNPDHLEPVTQQENLRRGQTGKWMSTREAYIKHLQTEVEALRAELATLRKVA